MTRTRWLVALLAVSLCFNVAAVVSAAATRSRPPAEHTTATCRLLETSGLTADQSRRLTALRSEFRARAETLQADYEARNAEMAHLALTESAGGAERIEALSHECAELHRRIQLLAVENLRAEAQVLGPDQRADYCSAVCSRICPRGAGGAESATGDCPCATPP